MSEMKKTIITSLVISIFLLAACVPMREAPTSSSGVRATEDDFITICLNGVAYWYNNEGSSHGRAMMAPRFNQDGEIQTCKYVDGTQGNHENNKE